MSMTREDRAVNKPAFVIPMRSPAKARLIATCKEIARAIDRLPEPACVVLEEARLLSAVRGHVETWSHAAGVFDGVYEALSSIGKAVTRARAVASHASGGRRR